MTYVSHLVLHLFLLKPTSSPTSLPTPKPTQPTSTIVGSTIRGCTDFTGETETCGRNAEMEFKIVVSRLISKLVSLVHCDVQKLTPIASDAWRLG